MSMNIFRLAGDMAHLFSIVVLLLRLRVAKNAQGTIKKRNERTVLLIYFLTCRLLIPLSQQAFRCGRTNSFSWSLSRAIWISLPISIPSTIPL